MTSLVYKVIKEVIHWLEAGSHTARDGIKLREKQHAPFFPYQCIDDTTSVQ